MKSPIASMALAAALAAPALAWGQATYDPRTGGGGVEPAAGTVQTPANAPASVPGTYDTRVLKAGEDVPEPIAPEDLAEPTIALPTGVPIDPYLLRKENGPFMVVVHTFRGPQATDYALALTLELRQQYQIPAYIFHLKIQPGGSNIRNVQPTAAQGIPNAQIAAPEKLRVYDEAAVLVGDCKTIDDAEALVKQVKKLRPKTLDGIPTIWGHRKGKGLQWAMVTANPLIPAQRLYPGGAPAGGPTPMAPVIQSGQTIDPYVAGAAFERVHKPDPLVERMNRGPRSLYRCKAPYTLPVAEFIGRSAVDPNDPAFNDTSFFKKSPLQSAADDAERYAANIARCKSLPDGLEVYVYHDRTSSTVTIGGFNGTEDPNLARLMKDMPYLIYEMLDKRYSLMPVSPKRELMDVPHP